MDTCAHMVGMVVLEGISSVSVEVGMDEVGKAHGTWVGTLLEVDGRAPCTDGDPFTERQTTRYSLFMLLCSLAVG